MMFEAEMEMEMKTYLGEDEGDNSLANKRIVECHLYRDTREHEDCVQQRKLLD